MRRRTKWLIGLAVLSAPFLWLGGLIVSDTIYLNRQIAAWVELTGARQPSDLAPVADEESLRAAKLYDEAAAMVEELDTEHFREWLADVDYSGPFLQAVGTMRLRPLLHEERLREMRPHYTEAVKLVREATQSPRAVWPTDDSAVLRDWRPWLIGIEQVSTVLVAEAFLLAGDGDHEGAGADLRSLIRMGEALGETPMVIASRVGAEVQSNALKCYRDAGARVDFVVEDLVRLDSERRLAAQWRNALAMQGTSWLHKYDEAGDLLKLFTHSGAIPKYVYEKVRPRRLMGNYLALMHHDLTAAIESVESGRPPRFVSKQDIIEAGRVAQLLINSRFIESFYTEGPASQRRLAMIATALRLHKRAQGAYPDTLDLLDLPGEVLANPLTGIAFTYAREGDGFVLLAVDPAEREDEGNDWAVWAWPR